MITMQQLDSEMSGSIGYGDELWNSSRHIASPGHGLGIHDTECGYISSGSITGLSGITIVSRVTVSNIAICRGTRDAT